MHYYSVGAKYSQQTHMLTAVGSSIDPCTVWQHVGATSYLPIANAQRLHHPTTCAELNVKIRMSDCLQPNPKLEKGHHGMENMGPSGIVCAFEVDKNTSKVRGDFVGGMFRHEPCSLSTFTGSSMVPIAHLC